MIKEQMMFSVMVCSVKWFEENDTAGQLVKCFVFSNRKELALEEHFFFHLRFDPFFFQQEVKEIVYLWKMSDNVPSGFIPCNVIGIGKCISYAHIVQMRTNISKHENAVWWSAKTSAYVHIQYGISCKNPSSGGCTAWLANSVEALHGGYVCG